MKFYEASSTISAKPERIWSILTHGSSYPSWDSGVERVEGRIAPGETIKVYVGPRSGIERQIIGSMGPVYSSRILNVDGLKQRAEAAGR